MTELVTASAWAYAVVAAFVALDAVLPVVPGEAVVITAAVLAADGELIVALVALAATVGSFAGDNASWRFGVVLGDRGIPRVQRSVRGRRMLLWARRQLRRRGRLVIVAARFVPGGRTATTLTAGAIGMPWRSFALADAVAAVIWSSYVTGLGWIGGTTFRDEEWKAIGLSLAIATVVGLTGEALRRVSNGDRARRA